ncbi:MAG: nitrate reductase cytochrome c-type subunit [Thermodesulfovibrionia bacterium]|nr:nitrate reductase cytochrome c-type subunit [Thermodesulfovibrionia bacterium]
MLREKKIWIMPVLAVSIVSLLLLSCAQTKIYTEEDLGLRHETLYDEDDAAPVYGAPITKEPGTSTRFERSFENSPPLIPHDITGMLPIAQTENICMGCHMPKEAVGAGATPIPKSHLTDLDTGKDLEGKLAGSRYNCMSCHVIQTELTPAVKNIFKGGFRDDKGHYRSNLIDNLNEGVETE